MVSHKTIIGIILCISCRLKKYVWIVVKMFKFNLANFRQGNKGYYQTVLDIIDVATLADRKQSS